MNAPQVLNLSPELDWWEISPHNQAVLETKDTVDALLKKPDGTFTWNHIIFEIERKNYKCELKNVYFVERTNERVYNFALVNNEKDGRISYIDIIHSENDTNHCTIEFNGVSYSIRKDHPLVSYLMKNEMTKYLGTMHDAWHETKVEKEIVSETEEYVYTYRKWMLSFEIRFQPYDNKNHILIIEWERYTLDSKTIYENLANITHLPVYTETQNGWVRLITTK